MNIAVCVKQVPDTEDIKFDPDNNTLIRESMPCAVNPFDADALEAAARIKDAHPETQIVAVSMGPEQAKSVLKECLAVAADKAYLISGPEFAGSDTLATGYILSRAIAKVEELEGKFDIIFCGKQATDGDTAQVGPTLAEFMDYPQVTCGLEVAVEGKMVRVLRENEDHKRWIGMDMPCVVTITKPSFSPRFPTIKRKMAANKVQIPTLGPGDLSNIDLTRAGAGGSPTKVRKMFTPIRDKSNIRIEEESNEESAVKLFKLLSDAKVI